MQKFQDMVFSTATRLLGNDAQAEDVAQETFIRAYENFSHLSASASAGGWLKTVTTNLCINHLTRHRKRWRLFSELRSEDAEEGADLDFEAPDDPLAELNAAQRALAVEAALKRLPDHQRVPLVLYHFDELSYEQIAVTLKVSLAKVKTDIRRGRAALVPALKECARDTLEH
jgi:RNA polymerase sigma-70 factor (ECF subfamily)